MNFFKNIFLIHINEFKLLKKYFTMDDSLTDTLRRRVRHRDEKEERR